jgi:hypothetical protein
MFQQIRCRAPLFIHCAQAAPVCPHCTNFFGYDNSGHDTVVMALKHVRSRDDFVRSRSRMREETMKKERSRLKKIVSAPLLSLAILGCLLLMAGCTNEGGPDSVTPVPTPPTFQPDILDKPIINAPAGEEGAPPFLFEFDTGNSSGFEEVRADRPGAPTLILGSNASATLPIVVSSEADTGVDVRVVRTDGLPDDVCVSYVPDSFTLQAGEKVRLKMHLAALNNRTIPAEAIVVWMEGAGWEVGRGFFLGPDHGRAGVVESNPLP